MALKRAFAARDLDYDFFDLFLQKQELSKGQLARTRAAAFDDMVVPSDDDDAVDANDFFRSVLAVYDRIFSVTEEQQKAVSALDQHDPTTGAANPKWLQARIGRLTGSSIAAIIGLNPYETADGFIRNKFWRTFKGNDATRYGNKYEDSCQNALEIVMHRRLKTFAGKEVAGFEILNSGLHIDMEKNYLAVSPDGVLILRFKDGSTMRVLLEYKCPYSKRGFQPIVTVLEKTDKNFRQTIYADQRTPGFDRVSRPIPKYYMPQLSHGMKLLDCQYAFFAVWVPYKSTDLMSDLETKAVDDVVSIQRDLFVTTYGTVQLTIVKRNIIFEEKMTKKLSKFWFEEFLPRQALYQLNALVPKQINLL